MTIMVFAPHPDDDLIGCGGSIAKHAAIGKRVVIVYLTSGDAGSRTITRETLGEIRETEATRAAQLLGVHDLVFLRRPDGYLTDSPALSTELINLIRENRPEIVYLPHADDDHPDHRATHTLAMKAIGQAAGPWFQDTTGEPWTVPTVLAYEVWTPIREVSYLEDITGMTELLRSALACHKSQLDGLDYEAMRSGLARYRGTPLATGSEAEAFSIIRAPVSSFTGR